MVAGSTRFRRITPDDTDPDLVAAGFATPAYADKATVRFHDVVSGFIVLFAPFIGILGERLVHYIVGGIIYNSTGTFTFTISRRPRPKRFWVR